MLKVQTWTKIALLLFIGYILISCDSVNDVKNKLLKDTPIGTTFNQVLEYCKITKLKCSQSKTAGFINQDTGKAIGVMSISAVISERKTSLLSTSTIEAYWGFDGDGKLIDIWVWKTIDSI